MKKNKKNNIYSIPSLHLEKHNTQELSLNTTDLFHKVAKYKNEIEHQPLNKKISTFLDYEKIQLEN